mmetsp:Transcript_2468/g.4475  ORF Transcript_2468/g.4475 Transcript_2468/m.4475 type:complete len:266 (+) Transcript_2468:18-815(+)
MTSRKKARGKARRALKAVEEGKKSNGDVKEEVKRSEEKEGSKVESLISQMEWLQMSGSDECVHGCVTCVCCLPPSDRVYVDFVDIFIDIYNMSVKENYGDAMASLDAAVSVMRDQHSEVYYNKMEWIISYLVAMGTKLVLMNDITGARFLAFFSYYFDQISSDVRDKYWQQRVCELVKSDEHTLVKYLRRRIPCECLDVKYKEVKSITKLGWCINPECPSGQKVDRSKMLCCTGCNQAHYCSRECHVADWPIHKLDCNAAASGQE